MFDDRLCLIDASGFIYRAYHAVPKLRRRADGFPVGALAGFCSMIWKFVRPGQLWRQPTHMAAVLDHSKRNFRHGLYPQYKGNRPPTPDELSQQLPLMRDAVQAFGLPAIDAEGFEADDVLATLARIGVEEGAETIIVSGDKDMYQLVRPGVRVYDPSKELMIGPAEVRAKFGVRPERVIDVQALAGDAVDNVPGVHGIGVKIAAELVNEFGDLEGVLAASAGIPQRARRTALIAQAELARLSLKLVTLRDDASLPITFDDLAVRPMDLGRLMSFLELMELEKLTRQINSTMLRITWEDEYVYSQF